jgi:integrase
VFANPVGRPLAYHAVSKGSRSAVKRSGINASGRLSLHSLRHAFASLLIAKGLNVVFVSRQLGHSNPTVTLGTYAHLFERADHAQSARAALQAGYAVMAESPGARG